MSVNIMTDVSIEHATLSSHHDLREPETFGLAPQIPLQPLNGGQDVESEGPVSNVVQVKQRWNQPRVNIWRLMAVFLTFFNLGANDASYGVGFALSSFSSSSSSSSLLISFIAYFLINVFGLISL